MFLSCDNNANNNPWEQDAGVMEICAVKVALALDSSFAALVQAENQWAKTAGRRRSSVRLRYSSYYPLLAPRPFSRGVRAEHRPGMAVNYPLFPT